MDKPRHAAHKSDHYICLRTLHIAAGSHVWNKCSLVRIVLNVVTLLRFVVRFERSPYSHAPRNDVSVNDGPHIGRWSHNIIMPTIVLQFPTVFSTVTCCTGL